MNIAEKMLSVIVPVYNAEAYLRRCINSIIAQSYNNIELILVDDGSTDKSPDICDEYALMDKRVKIIHQENQGQGLARLRGVNLASGNYITFVDDDDYIRPDMYTKMIALLEKNKADICACLWNYETEDGYQSVDIEEYLQNTSIVGLHFSSEFVHYYYSETPYEYGIISAPWNKIYKRNLLKDCSFSGKRGEEEEMLDNIYSRGCNIYVCDCDFYIWCLHGSSMSHKGFSMDWLHLLDVYSNRIRLFANDSYMVRQTRLRYIDMCMEYYYGAKDCGGVFPRKYLSQLTKCYLGLLGDKESIGAKYFLRVSLFMISPFCYEKIVKFFKV